MKRRAFFRRLGAAVATVALAPAALVSRRARTKILRLWNGEGIVIESEMTINDLYSAVLRATRRHPENPIELEPRMWLIAADVHEEDT